jgi:penicillin-binding protein 2
MGSIDQRRRETVRFLLILGALAAAMLFLAGSLWNVQVRRASAFETSFDRQSVRRVRLPAARGTIFDRNGDCLAGNKPNFCLAVYIEELRQPGKWSRTVAEVERVLDRTANVVGRPPGVTTEDIWKHIRQRLPLPFIAWRNLTFEELARWECSETEEPSVDVYVEPVRCYPRKSLAAHAVGYVRRMDPGQDGDMKPYHYYLPDFQGECGAERAFDSILAGEAGGRLIRVTAAGYKYDAESEREPVSGRSIVLTLDRRTQAELEAQLAGGVGAAVVLDPRNGDILGMASSPGFDLSDFSPAISRAALDRLTADPRRPFVNRAVRGLYAPGSTFKPIVALASLENRRATADQHFNCPGHFRLGDTFFRCWDPRGHGSPDLRKAIEQSCNAYFCQLGLRCGYDRIYHMAEALGMGRPTGVELAEELGGLLPDSRWKERCHGDIWRPGDTCNASIGQGPILCTPLQMAVVAAALANGGLVYRPRLLLEILDPGANPYTAESPGRAVRPGALVTDMGWSRTSLNEVRGGMYDVVNEEDGTGARARVAGVEVAGKTGTAEYGTRVNRRKYAWMIAFAPYANPRYAVSIVVEDALSGGRTAAPKVARILAAAFAAEAAAADGGAG